MPINLRLGAGVVIKGYQRGCALPYCFNQVFSGQWTYMHTHTTCWRRNHLGYHVLLEIILDSFCDRGFSIHVKRNHLGYQVMLESLVRYIPESTCNTIFCFPVVEESYSMAKFYQYLSIITNSVLSFLAQFIIYIAQYYH